MNFMLTNFTRLPRAPTLHHNLNAMASVFPFEIYDEIIELVGHNEDLIMAKYTFQRCSLVCQSRHWKCRPLLWRVINFRLWGIPELYAFRQFIISAPHLAELIREIHIREFRGEPPSRCFISIVDIIYSVITKHLPRLTNVIITTQRAYRDRFSFHRYFAHPRLQFQTVTTLNLKGAALSDTFELDRLLIPFPNIHTLDMYEVYWMPLDLDKAHRLPRLSRVVPAALSDLPIAYRGCEPEASRTFLLIPESHLIPRSQFALTEPYNLVGLDQLLRAVSGTLAALSLKLPVTRALTMVPQCKPCDLTIHCALSSEC